MNPKWTPEAPCKVVLTCGCQLSVRNGPLNGKARYACEARLGHGYQLRWTTYTSRSGKVIQNPEAP